MMRALRIGLVLLVILGGLLIGGDRIAVRMAENEIAAKVRGSLSLDSEPEVSVRGFPFLTQLLGKQLNQVDLEMDSYQLRLDDESATVRDLSIQLSDVALRDNYAQVVAARAEGDGMISYEEMAKIAGDGDSSFGVSFDYADTDQVEVRITVMDRAVGPSMVGEVIAEGGGVVRLEVQEIPSFADIPVIGSIDGIEQQIRQRLDQQRVITGLPEGVELTGLEPTPDGMRLIVSGTDVDLTDSGE